MKKLLTASLPALALLALGGCAASRSVATTEDDGVYYSRQDRTTAVARAPQPAASQGRPAPAADDAGQEANPDYQASSGGRQPASNAPEYYDDNYNRSYDNASRFRRPYQGPTVGLAYYAPPVVFAPVYNGFAYGSGFDNFGYSPFGGPFYDPFFGPVAFAGSFYQPYGFYDPFFYGFGPRFINIGFGRPWGGFGHGRGFFGGAYAYDPFLFGGYYCGNSFGRGYQGYSHGLANNDYYGGNYGGNRPIVRANGSGSDSPVLVGRRGGRGGDVLAGRGSDAAGNQPAPPSGGRRNMDGVAPAPGAPASGIVDPSAPATAADLPVGAGNSGRRRMDDGRASAPNRPTPIAANQDPSPTAGTRLNDEAGTRGAADPTGRSAAPAAGAEPGRPARSRWRNLDESGAGATTTGDAPAAERGYEQPAERPTRRGRFAEMAPDNGQAQPGYGRRRAEQQPAAQPEPQPEQPRRTYERQERQERQEQPQRTYERQERQERQEQPQRSYEQPQRQEQPQRSYEQPQREERSASPSPSYSSPASSGSNGGGDGGGGDGGGRRGGRW